LRVFLALLLRVGIVKTQVTLAVIILRQPEIQADRLGVADVQITVRLGREARDDTVMPTRGEIGIND